MNLKTGIHFGVIPKNDLFNCAEEFFDNAKDMTYEGIIDEIHEAIQGLSDYIDEETINEMIGMAETNFGDRYDGDCAEQLYERDGYIIQSNADGCDLFVIKSPYYTYAPPCSPCAPGAGYLRDAVKNKNDQRGLKTYCLSDNWFEEGQCPYEYWEVEDDNIGVKHVQTN